MTQKVIKVGDSAAVVIPKKSLKELGIRVGSNVNVKINEETKVMSIHMVNNKSNRQEKIANLTLNFIKRYKKDLESLADK